MNRTALIIGLTTLVLGISHFWLPWAYDWNAFLRHEPMLNWTVHVLNYSVSVFFVIAGTGVVWHVLNREQTNRERDFILCGLMAYWLSNVAFQCWWPMPAPTATARIIPLLFALFQLGCCVIVLASKWRTRTG